MKAIFLKFKINSLTYLLFLTFLFTGYIKNGILIFSIVLVHELGHILLLKFFHIEINSVEIFPFGGITKTSKLVNTKINKDIVIYLGGILNQLFFSLLFLCFYKYSWISLHTLNLFNYYNKSVLLFNLLPIRPLDGGEIVKLLLEKIFSFKLSYKISSIVSIIALFLFVLFNIKYNLNEYVVISFLIFKIWEIFKQEHHFFYKFLLERYLYILPYNKIKYEKTKNLNRLKKETYHYFKEQNNIVSERTLLEHKFDRKKNF